MHITYLRISFFSLFLFTYVTSLNQPKTVVRIYSNLAEIIQPVDQLPLVFTNDDWNDIRSDSIILLGEDLNVTSQSITEKKKSFNGAQVYIRAPRSIDKSSLMLLRATLIDEKRNLVKIQDEVISGNEVLYFTVNEQDIFYNEEPLESKFYVDFTYVPITSKPSVSYLRFNIYWKTDYQLILHNNKSELFVMANIRNNGKSSISIDQAELFSGDIKFNMQSQQYRERNSYGSMNNAMGYRDMIILTSERPTVSQSEELMGVHVFPINKPFTIDGQTNYLLPMFRPQIEVERYNSISKSFSTIPNTGKAQRSYRLKSDRYLSQGNCIIRENDRIVGETMIPNLATDDKYEFTLGEDAGIIYKENVTLISSKEYQEENKSPTIYIQRFIRNIYKIELQMKNVNTRSIKVEYTQTSYYNRLEIIESTDNFCIRDSSLIKCKTTLDANNERTYSYSVAIIT